jgi:RNA polymerase sigma factor (sigma-70 family)
VEDRDRHIRAGLWRRSPARLRFAADARLVALVRAGDQTSFEILYDRYAAELFAFCRYMLGSRADAEDALQSTFAAAHAAMLADDRSIDTRPWLFTIARNASVSILRARRSPAHLSGEGPAAEDPVAHVEQRDDVRQLLAALAELPENQRVALVLSELHGFSHSEIGGVLGVRTEQVKAYVFQARSNLIAERDARSAACEVIRRELAQARGAALLKSRLRRHLRSCPGCRAYAAQLSRQRRQLGSLLPVTPSLELKSRALHAALGRAPTGATHTSGLATTGAAGGGAPCLTTGAELAGGGAKALLAKLLVGVACLGAGSGAATLMVGGDAVPGASGASPATLAERLEPSSSRPVSRRATQARGRLMRQATRSSRPLARRAAPTVQRVHLAHGEPQPLPGPVQNSQLPHALAGSDGPGGGSNSAAALAAGVTSEAPHGKSEAPHGKSEEAHGKSEEPHGKSEAAHGKSEEPRGKSEAPHGKSEEPRGKSEAPHGKSEEPRGKSEAPHGKSEEPRGKSEAPHGKSEEAHGNGEEARVNSEEPHGRSEAPHGKN